MRKYLIIICCTILCIACNTAAKKDSPVVIAAEKPKTDTVIFPYQPLYSSSFNNDVPDKDVLTVLNSYKYWENGFLADLAGLYADTITFIPADGAVYSGPKSGLLEKWTAGRDSIKMIRIQVIAWTKVHETVKGDDFIDVWYRETDVLSSGETNVANYADRKQLVNGKITWYSQYRQQAR